MPELRSSKQRREQLVRSLRAEGRSWVEVAEVLRQRYRFNARVAFRYAHCWSRRQAADEWNRLWPDELKTFKNFSYWEQWPSSTGHAPSFGNFSKLAQLYECAVCDLLVDLPDFRHLDIMSSAQETRLPMLKPDTGLILPKDSTTSQSLSNEKDNGRAVGPIKVYSVGRGESEGSSVPTRREVFGYVGAGLTAVGLDQDQMSAGLQGGLPRVVQALEVTRQAVTDDPAALEDLNTVVEHYKKTFRSTPPVEMYNELLGVRVHAGSLLDGGRAANNRNDLLVAAGWLSNVLAIVTHDLDDRAAPLVWCADAERCSREAVYPELAGWAAQIRAVMSFYGGQGREALTHAQRGQTLAPFGTVAHANLVTQEMRAWALLGNSDKVSSTRRRAEQAIAKLPTNTPTQGRFAISPAEDPPCTGTSLLLLGRHKEAAEVTRRGIATLYGPCVGEGRGENPSGFARAYLILALALAGLGEPDEAYAAGSMALEAPRLVRSGAVLAGKLDRTLMRDFVDTTEARDYHERYVAAVQTEPSVGG